MLLSQFTYYIILEGGRGGQHHNYIDYRGVGVQNWATVDFSISLLGLLLLLLMLLLILLQRTFVHLTLLDAAGEFVWCFTKQGWIVLELGLRQLESGIKAMKLTLRNV